MYEEVINECFFCGHLIAREAPGAKGKYDSYLRDMTTWLVDGKHKLYGCRACGAYLFTGGEYINSIVWEADALAKVRHFLAVRKRQNIDDPSKGEVLEFTGELLSLIMERPLLSPPEQADNMIRFLANSTMAIDYQDIGYRIHGGIIGSNSYAEFKLVYRYLVEKNFIDQTGRAGAFPDESSIGDLIVGYTSLTVDGWQYYRQLQKGEASNNRGFMAMKFGNKKLSNILESKFKPAAKEAGFELFRLDEKLGAGLIDNQMLVEIQNSDFVVADLTDGNRGAYFEAGYAKGLGKPVIFTCEKLAWEKEKTHFDVNHYHTITWEANNPSEAANKLKFTIRATLPDKAKMSDDEE